MKYFRFVNPERKFGPASWHKGSSAEGTPRRYIYRTGKAGVHAKVKHKFVDSGLMTGQFHKIATEPGKLDDYQKPLLGMNLEAKEKFLK